MDTLLAVVTLGVDVVRQPVESTVQVSPFPAAQPADANRSLPPEVMRPGRFRLGATGRRLDRSILNIRLFRIERWGSGMAVQTYDHPILQTFAMIRRIENDVREQIAESLPAGLSVPQYEVMRLLDLKGEGVTPAEIAMALQINKSGLTTSLQRLDASGFIRVEPCPEDGRKKRIWMTPAGQAIYIQARDAIRPKMSKLREAFTLDEFREALPFLKALQTWFAERDWD
jgi:DNA-binding MarR family transcriptional regulator